jgi:predicted small secreted protein
MIRTILVTTILSLLLCLSGCNTMEGLGKDLEKLGGSIGDAAKKK